MKKETIIGGVLKTAVLGAAIVAVIKYEDYSRKRVLKKKIRNYLNSPEAISEFNKYRDQFRIEQDIDDIGEIDKMSMDQLENILAACDKMEEERLLVSVKDTILNLVKVLINIKPVPGSGD